MLNGLLPMAAEMCGATASRSTTQTADKLTVVAAAAAAATVRQLLEF
jgi:hypothetical protein